MEKRKCTLILFQTASIFPQLFGWGSWYIFSTHADQQKCAFMDFLNLKFYANPNGFSIGTHNSLPLEDSICQLRNNAVISMTILKPVSRHPAALVSIKLLGGLKQI